MKNKFRIGEIVIVDGISAIYEKHFSGLGIIEEKDYYYNQYLVTMLSNEKEDWFSEESIRSVMDRRIKKKEKYKVVLAIDKRGIEYILEKVKEMPKKYNNILEKMDFYKEYRAYRKKYVILVWTSTYWSETNFAVKCIQDSFKELRKQNIAYKQIIIGETDPTQIKINEFIDNDINVDVFNIFHKIELKNIGGILV